MKKALVIGGAGFVGKHLIKYISKDMGWEVFVTKLPGEDFNIGDVTVYELDILDKESVDGLIGDIKPDYVFHLAAQSSVALSWGNPSLTIDINIKGTLNVIEAVKNCANKPRLLLVGSSEEYGTTLSNQSLISETRELNPGNIYAVTKICQNYLGNIYSKAYDTNVIMVRAFNHIGPGQAPSFVVSDFCKQVAEIESGRREPVIYVGNSMNG